LLARRHAGKTACVAWESFSVMRNDIPSSLLLGARHGLHSLLGKITCYLCLSKTLSAVRQSLEQYSQTRIYYTWRVGVVLLIKAASSHLGNRFASIFCSFKHFHLLHVLHRSSACTHFTRGFIALSTLSNSMQFLYISHLTFIYHLFDIVAIMAIRRAMSSF
jgi:hypothetical protein